MSTKNKSRSYTNNTTSQSSTQSQRNSAVNNSQLNAYDPAQGGIDYGLGMASQHLYNPDSQAVYGGQRVADLSAGTQQGMAGLMNNEGYDRAGSFYKNTLDGEYLNAGNPYINQVQQSVMDATMPGINATFGRSGMAGSTIHQNQLAQGLSNGMAGHLFANYENERNRQMAAAGQLPAMYRQQAGDALTAGGIQDQQNQNIINSDMARFEEQRTAPIRSLNEAMPYLMQAGQAFGNQRNAQDSTSYGNASGTSNTQGTTTTTSKPSMFSSILGGGMMGLSALGGMSPMLGGMMQPAAQQPLITRAASNMYTPPPLNPYSTQPWT